MTYLRASTREMEFWPATARLMTIARSCWRRCSRTDASSQRAVI